MNWTEEQLSAFQASRLQKGKSLAVVAAEAKPRKVKPKFDSAWEEEYFSILQQQLGCGDIQAFWYHPFTLRLHAGISYTPDFMVQSGPQTLIDEVKGHWREKDRLRYKLAVATFPFWKFSEVVKLGGVFVRREVLLRQPVID